MFDDEAAFLISESSARTRRFWPYPCALMIGAAAAVGGHACWRMAAVGQSADADAVSSLYSPLWGQAWRAHDRRHDDYDCTWDGDDCRRSRCCAKEGSRCFVKNSRWASCNETCHYNVKWTAGADNRGHWVATTQQHWQCVDLTVSPAATAAPATEAPATAAPATAKPATAKPATANPATVSPVATAAPSVYSVYDQKTEHEQSDYGKRVETRSSLADPPVDAHVSWEQLE